MESTSTPIARRMGYLAFPAEGAGPNDSKAERVTADAGEDWFPHPSPDERKWVF